MADRLLRILLGLQRGFDERESEDEDPALQSSEEQEALKKEKQAKLTASDLGSRINHEAGRTGLPPNRKHLNTSVVSNIIERGRSLRSLQPYMRKTRQRILSNMLPFKHRSLISEYPSHLFCGLYSENGETFVSASQEDEIRMFKCHNNKMQLFKTFSAREVGWAIVDVAYSPDQMSLLYSSWSNRLHFINMESDRYEVLPLGDSLHMCPFSIKFSHDSKEIITGSNQNAVFIYDLGADRTALEVAAHDDDVNAVSFADACSNIFFTGSDDSLCKVWDRRLLRDDSPRPVGVCGGHYQGITFIDSMGDGIHFLSQSKDSTIKLWDIRKMGKESSMTSSRRRIDYRYQQFTHASSMKPLDHDTSLMTYSGHVVQRTLIRARFSPLHSTGQQYIYSGSADGNIYIYDVLIGELVHVLRGHHSICRDVSWHPFDPTLISSGWDGRVAAWSVSPIEVLSSASSSPSSSSVNYYDQSSEDEFYE